MSIQTLFQDLKDFCPSRVAEDFRSHASPSGWKEYAKDDLKGNAYVRKRVYQNDLFEIFVITWPPGSQSPIHDHATGGCVMRIVQGELEEKRYDSKTLEHVSTERGHYEENHTSYIQNEMHVHSIHNPSSTEVAVSVHIYSPPNHKMKIYKE